MIKALLFDLDGVFIETEKETFKFYQDYFKKFGVDIPDAAFKYKAGRKSMNFFEDILTPEQLQKFDVKEITNLKRESFNSQIEKYVNKVPNGKELLEALKEDGYKLALTTQNESRMAETAINWLGIKNYFDIIITLDDITNKKPDPEIYLKAAKDLDLSNEECIVIEDSKDGINSAYNAKMFCIALRHDYMPQDTYDNASVIIKDFLEIKQILQDKI